MGRWRLPRPLPPPPRPRAPAGLQGLPRSPTINPKRSAKMADREWALPAFGARVKDRARRLGLASFWQWWTHELDALMPSAPRAALTRRRMRPVLVFSGDFATLWRPATANGQPVMTVGTTIPLTGDAASVAAAGRAALAP